MIHPKNRELAIVQEVRLTQLYHNKKSPHLESGTLGTGFLVPEENQISKVPGNIKNNS
jgi:hypothetical protein